MENKKDKKPFIGRFMSVDVQALIAIHNSEQLKLINKYDQIIAYLTLSGSVQKDIYPRITTASKSAISRNLSCGGKRAKKIFESLRLIAKENGECIIGSTTRRDIGGSNRIVHELSSDSETDFIQLPNSIIKKITHNPNVKLPTEDKSRIPYESLRCFMTLFRHNEPIEFWGFNPFTSIRLEYGSNDEFETNISEEIISNIKFTFFPKESETFVGFELVADMFNIPETEVSGSDIQTIHKLRDDLYNRAFLMYAVTVMDKATSYPLYKLKVSDKNKSKNVASYKTLQDEVLNLYQDLSGCDDEKLKSIKESFYVAATPIDQEIQLIGIYSAKFSPSCSESAVMIENWELANTEWMNFFTNAQNRTIEP